MAEIVKILIKVALGLVGFGAGFLAVYLLGFTFIAFLVPTSSPYQAGEWAVTVVSVFGIKISKLWIVRLQIAAVGIGVVLICSTISLFCLWMWQRMWQRMI
jgi:hypothetical protein